MRFIDINAPVSLPRSNSEAQQRQRQAAEREQRDGPSGHFGVVVRRDEDASRLDSDGAVFTSIAQIEDLRRSMTKSEQASRAATSDDDDGEQQQQQHQQQHHHHDDDSSFSNVLQHESAAQEQRQVVESRSSPREQRYRSPPPAVTRGGGDVVSSSSIQLPTQQHQQSSQQRQRSPYIVAVPLNSSTNNNSLNQTAGGAADLTTNASRRMTSGVSPEKFPIFVANFWLRWLFWFCGTILFLLGVSGYSPNTHHLSREGADACVAFGIILLIIFGFCFPPKLLVVSYAIVEEQRQQEDEEEHRGRNQNHLPPPRRQPTLIFRLFTLTFLVPLYVSWSVPLINNNAINNSAIFKIHSWRRHFISKSWRFMPMRFSCLSISRQAESRNRNGEEVTEQVGVWDLGGHADEGSTTDAALIEKLSDALGIAPPVRVAGAPPDALCCCCSVDIAVRGAFCPNNCGEFCSSCC